MTSKARWIIGVSAVLSLLTLTVWLWPSSSTVPKPDGYLRIQSPDVPPMSLQTLTGPDLPYSMDVHGSSQWEGRPETGWGDLVYPWCRGRLQLTYKPVEGNLGDLIDDAHTLAFKHSVVADGISQKLYVNPETKVYGVLFKLEGNAASSVQFFATDSTSHFIRGAAYVFAPPNADSLAPVHQFFEAEVIRYLESLRWK
jgi:gliding motility-associated lipoprotein GldD